MTTLYDYCKQNNKEYLLKEWNYELNKNIDLKIIHIGSHTKAWWKCSKCGYEWEAEIRRRVKGSQCPCCTNQIVVIGINDLTTTHPEIAKEWHPIKNNNLTPQNITAGSNKRIWWKCIMCGHEWQTSVYHRSINASGCPKCRHSKRKNSAKQDSLNITHPKIAKDWHISKNGKLKPGMFTKGSRYKAWWKCHICGKESQKEIKLYNGCTNCKKNERLSIKNLAIEKPNLIKEWNYNKNNNLKPENCATASNKRVWWKCSKCGYEWEAKIGNRSILDRGCPLCANKKVITGINDLTTTHPEIAKEWHPTKNANLTPEKVTHGTSKKVWWICPQGHEYQATISHRTQDNGTNCPICNSGKQTSFAEQAVYYYVKKLYPDAINRYMADFLGRMELDIYIPSINCAIEYDGEAWHTGEIKLKREEKKYKICKSKNIKLIRLREKETKVSVPIADIQFCENKLYEYPILEKTISLLLKYLDINSIGYKIDVNIKRDKSEILQYKTILNKNTLQDKYPEIAKEWHPTKNGNLKPNMFKPGSDYKVWWICKTCGHEWYTKIYTRTRGSRCPICGIEKATKTKRKAVNMIDYKTNKVIRTFISISDASRKMHINDSNISMVCKGKRPFAGGYKWSYAEQI